MAIEASLRSDLLIRVLPHREATEHLYAAEASLNGGPLFPLRDLDFGGVDFKALEGNAWDYGRKLGEILFRDSDLSRALDFALGESKASVRLRLQIDVPLPLLWERAIYGAGRDEMVLGASAKVALSRSADAGDREKARAGAGAFRLLLAIASPDTLDEATPMKPVQLAEEIDNLRAAWDPLILRGQLRARVLARLPEELAEGLRAAQYEVVNKAVTRDELFENLTGMHGAHFICHGALNNTTGEASLLIENEVGGAAALMEADLLSKLDSPDLRLLFLQACKSAARVPGSLNVLSGLASKAAKRVPAVVAMQDFVQMADARLFAGEFYQTLLRTGEADIAVNAGRRCVLQPGRSSWSIPAIFQDSRRRIWEPDPVISAVQDLADNFRRRPEVARPFPIEVIRRCAGLQAQTETAPPGPRTPVIDAVESAFGFCCEVIESDRVRIAAIVGNYGRAKSSQLKRIFTSLAGKVAEYGAVPLFLRIGQFKFSEGSPVDVIADAISCSMQAEAEIELRGPAIVPCLAGHVVLILDADEDTSNRTRDFAYDALAAYLESHSNASLVLTMEEHSFAEIAPFGLSGGMAGGPPSALFFVQLLSPAAISKYLHSFNGADKEKGKKLLEGIASANLFDLAAVPWLLGSLIAQKGSVVGSRSAVIERVCNANLAAVDWPPGGQRIVRDALGRAAWAMQENQATRLDTIHFYEVLDAARGRRELSLEELRRAALESQILRPSKEDGVRFAYPGFQSQWCAHYLIGCGPGMERRLEDITAALGRRARVRLWEDTLMLLSGLIDNPGRLLRRILAGSTLSQGEQTFLAARCIHEARLSGKSVPEDVSMQVLDNLICRSQYGRESSTDTRVRAIEALALMRDPTAIPHLLAVSSDRVRVTSDGAARYELSNMRKAALAALLAMQNETEEYVKSLAEAPATQKLAQGMMQVIAAWRQLDSKALEQTLLGEDQAFASIAAFALGSIGGDENLEILTKQIGGATVADDLSWAIADSLLQFNPVDVTAKALKVMVANPALKTQCAYIIGKARIATEGSEQLQFLAECLVEPQAKMQGMALRALAQLGNTSKKTLCECIAMEDWDRAKKEFGFQSHGGRRSAANDQAVISYYALESLRLIGDGESIESLRMARCKRRLKPLGSQLPQYLLELNYEISEEIYWRLTQGLEGEYYDSPSLPSNRRD